MNTSAESFNGSSSVPAKNKEPSADFSKIFVQILKSFEQKTNSIVANSLVCAHPFQIEAVDAVNCFWTSDSCKKRAVVVKPEIQIEEFEEWLKGQSASVSRPDELYLLDKIDINLLSGFLES